MTNYRLETETVIDAPVGNVWRALTTLSEYPRWNPLIPHAQGDLKVGSTLRITIHPPGAKRQGYRVKILEVEERRRLRWLGHFGLAGLIDGDHVFELHRVDDHRTRLVHNEAFRGLLVPVLWNSFFETKMRAGFEALNLGLKAYLELPVVRSAILSP